MTWALAILDDGISNAVQARAGKATAAEHDYYRNIVETDESVADTHGGSVFLSALRATRSLDVIDLKIGSPTVDSCWRWLPAAARTSRSRRASPARFGQRGASAGVRIVATRRASTSNRCTTARST